MPGKDLFGETIKYEDPKGKRNKGGGYIENPMHAVFGKNENERCKSCIHLVYKQYAKRYYKCELRGNVDKCSAASDHKVNWFACGKFEKETK
jgi:hypothetical protein